MMKTDSAEILFGLVRVPVKVTGTTKTPPSFKTLHANCLTPTSQQIWCEKCQKTVDRVDTVKGVKAGDKWMAVPADDLEAAKAERSRVITITKFIPDNGFDPEDFYKHYHLMPDDNDTVGYALLTAAMEKREYNGFGSMRIWGKEHPCLIRPHWGGMMMTLLYLAEDRVTRPYDPPELPGKPAEQKLLMAEALQLIDSRAGLVDMTDLTSKARTRREQLVEQISSQLPEATPAADLLTMLRLSIGGKKKVKA